MKYIPAAVIGVLLAAVLSIQPGKAYDPTLEECEGDYRADWEDCIGDYKASWEGAECAWVRALHPEYQHEILQ